MKYSKRLINLVKKRNIKKPETSDIEYDDKKYTNDEVLDKSDNSDPLNPLQRKKVNKSKIIQSQLQDQFLNAMQKQSQLQQQQQQQSQGVGVSDEKMKTVKDDNGKKYKTLVVKNMDSDDENNDEFGNYGELRENINEYEDMPDLVAEDMNDLSYKSGSLINEDYIKNIEGQFDPDVLLDPLTQSHLYSNYNKWYVNALRQRNELISKYQDPNINSRDKSNLEEVINGLENKLVKFERDASTQSSGVIPIHKMTALKEWFELKKMIYPKYHKYLDKHLYKNIINSDTKENFLNNPIIKTIIKSGSINSVESSGCFTDLWDKVKSGYTKTRNIVSNVWNKFKDVGEDTFRFVDTHPQIIPIANRVIRGVSGRPNIDINQYYTKAQDIFTRLPRISNGLNSMGLNIAQATRIINDINKSIFDNSKVSINKILKSNGILSSGINNVLLSSGLIQDLVDLNIPQLKIEQLLDISSDKKKDIFNLKNHKAIIELIKNNSSVNLNDDIFKNIISKSVSSGGIINKDEFMNFPEVISIIENSKDKTLSSGFFETFFNGIKNFGRNFVHFLAPAAPLVRQITPLISALPGVGQIMAPIAGIVNKTFDTVENINQKINPSRINSRGVVSSSGEKLKINPEIKKKLKKTVTKF